MRAGRTTGLSFFSPYPRHFIVNIFNIKESRKNYSGNPQRPPAYILL